MRLLCFSLICFFSVGWSTAQPDNTWISDRYKVTPTDSSIWGIHIRNFNYLRNTEYFNSIEQGRTLFGYHLMPTVFLQTGRYTRLQAGMWLRHDFGGKNPFTQVLPVFTFTYQKNKHTLHFGVLEGATSHRLIEPLMDIQSAIERRIENGFQYRRVAPRSFLDTWINWEQFIERGTPHKEQFTAGLHYTPDVFHSDNGWRVSIPIQAVVFHRGGQIDTDTGNMVLTANMATGIQLTQEFQSSVIRQWQADVYAVGFMEKTQSGYFPYREGTGLMCNTTATFGKVALQLSYWNGSRFDAPRGTLLYRSVSADNPLYTESNRELLFLRGMYNTRVNDQLQVSARVEPVMDLKNGQLDYSYSLYLLFELDKTIGRWK